MLTIEKIDALTTAVNLCGETTIQAGDLLPLLDCYRLAIFARWKPGVPTELFQPGLYEHHRGGLYRGLFIATHHETNQPFVIYVPYEHPESGMRLREWHTIGARSWRDEVSTLNFQPDDEELRNPDPIVVPRFKWVRP